MSQVAVFHSALGVRPGVHEAARLLRSSGHDARIVDQYGGRTFEDYDAGIAHATAIGYPSLMQAALDGVSDLPPGFVALGFSNGGGMAEYVAAQRPDVSGVILLAGALDPAVIGLVWPPGVPCQIHYTESDPWRDQASIDALVQAIEAGGAGVEVFDYPGSGHLFADPSKQDEYQPVEAALMWSRVLTFLAGSRPPG